MRSDVQVGRQRAERDAQQATATAGEWAGDSNGQTTARLDQNYADTTTSPEETGVYHDRGTGSHRSR